MLNVHPSSSSSSQKGGAPVGEFCDYVSDLSSFGLDTDRAFRINELYYPGASESTGGSQIVQGVPPPVEDYSEYLKGSTYGCFNAEDFVDLVQGNHQQNNASGLVAPLSEGSYCPSNAVLAHISQLMRGISSSMSFTDVNLLAESKSIAAHKSILASHSTFLRQILLLHESPELEEPSIQLPDVRFHHLQMMVGFFYTGEVCLSHREDLLPLRELCVSLGVSSIIGRLDELSISLNPSPYDGNTMMLHSTGDLDPLDAVTGDLPHLSNTEIDSIYLNGGDTSLPPQPPPTLEVPCAQPPLGEQGSVPSSPSSRQSQGLSTEVQGRVKKKAFSCLRCQSKFYTQESLHVHESLHEEVKPFSCEICGKSIATKGHLAVHMRIHSGEKPYACDECDKSFMDSSSLKRHKGTHGTRTTHECGICSKVFGDRSTYKRHYKEKHMEGTKKYDCHLCHKLFLRRETLNAHFIKVHSLSPDELFDKDKAKEIEDSKKWKTFKCTVCSMMFSKQSTMEIHLRTHTGDKPYVCEVCGKKFTRSNNLKLHKRVHTGEKPYQCSQCDKRFSDVSAHKRHLRTHTGEKPYECSKCQKGFIQIGAKNVHEKSCAPPPTKMEGFSEIEKGDRNLTTNPHTVPGTLYVSQEQQQGGAYNPIVDDSSLANMENHHPDLQVINI